MRKPTKDDRDRYKKAFRDMPQNRIIFVVSSLLAIWLSGFSSGFTHTQMSTSLCFLAFGGVFLCLNELLHQNDIFTAMKLAEDGELLEDD